MWFSVGRAVLDGDKPRMATLMKKDGSMGTGFSIIVVRSAYGTFGRTEAAHS
jgi:hypothetical protein